MVELFDPGSGPVLRGHWVHYGLLDGSEFLPNGDKANFSASFPIGDGSTGSGGFMNFESKTGQGDLMIFFDDPNRFMQFSRGVGLTAGYQASEWDLEMNVPGFAGVLGNSGSYKYRFEYDTIYLGPRAAFSIGVEPIRQMSLLGIRLTIIPIQTKRTKTHEDTGTETLSRQTRERRTGLRTLGHARVGNDHGNSGCTGARLGGD